MCAWLRQCCCLHSPLVAVPALVLTCGACWLLFLLLLLLQVLEGVVLVFSRVIPLETNPRQHPLWLLAEQYGATCSEQCSEDTTHVVAMTGGTEKVRVRWSSLGVGGTCCMCSSACVHARMWVVRDRG